MEWAKNSFQNRPDVALLGKTRIIAGNPGDKILDYKLMYIPDDDNSPICRLKSLVKSFDYDSLNQPIMIKQKFLSELF